MVSDLKIITPNWRELPSDSAWVGRFWPVLLNVTFGVSAAGARTATDPGADARD